MADREFSSLQAFAAFIEGLAAGVEAPFLEATEPIAHVLHDKAMHVFGDNQKLANLAASTQAEREALGYAPDEPLLRDGSLLRDRVEMRYSPGEAAIGSPEIVQMYHEFGYENHRTGTHVPERPVFKTALDESQADVEALLGEATGAALGFVEIGEVKRG